MTVLIYNNATTQMERYSMNLNDAMPYNNNRTLTVREFRARSVGNIVWTDTHTMRCWNITRAAWARPIMVGSAFRRIGEGGHANQSQHYAGTSFDVAQNIGNTDRAELRGLASRLGVWTYVEPANLTPTWVHFDARWKPPACEAGYPVTRQGSRGIYVCTLQDALGTIGISGVNIDGLFGPITVNAVMNFQRSQGLSADGIVGCATWTRLTAIANGRNRP